MLSCCPVKRVQPVKASIGHVLRQLFLSCGNTDKKKNPFPLPRQGFKSGRKPNAGPLHSLNDGVIMFNHVTANVLPVI